MQYVAIPDIPQTYGIHPMDACRPVTTKTNGIYLSADNNSLHEQLQKAVQKNLTLRLQCDTVEGKQVLYLRERSVGEFFRETWDRLFGKGEVAAAAKQAAWDAVHQQLNERIASARADHGKISAPTSNAATEEEGKAEAERNLWNRYTALKQATSAARGTAAAVYPHIMGIKPEHGKMAIISETLSIRLHSTAMPRKSGAISNLDDSLAIAVDAKAPGAPMEECIRVLYRTQLAAAQAELAAAQAELAAAQAKSDAAQAKPPCRQFIHLDWQYKPDEAFHYGYSQEDWKEIHKNGLTQAIYELTAKETLRAQLDAPTRRIDEAKNKGKPQTQVVIDVVSNNASTFNELRETLELSEQDKSSAHHMETLKTLTNPPELNRT